MARNRINRRLNNISRKTHRNKVSADNYTGKGTLARGEFYGTDWGDKRDYRIQSTGNAKYRNTVVNTDNLKMRKVTYPDGTVRKEWVPGDTPNKKERTFPVQQVRRRR